VSLSHSDVEHTLTQLLNVAPRVDFRVVGTASSLLRGIALPVNDIDILFGDRLGVDAWFDALSTVHEVEHAPAWIADASQYFARLRTKRTVIELSTVEIETELDTLECAGAGPWRHFDLVRCGERSIPAVATELRFITEYARGRKDRYRAIAEHLRRAGCDIALVRRGLSNLRLPAQEADAAIASLA
jgi:hypothetical protein